MEPCQSERPPGGATQIYESLPQPSREEMRNPLVAGGSAASPASDAIPSVVVAADAGGVPSSVEAGVEPQGRLRPSGRPAMTAPHWPAPVGARVHVEGHGEGNYAGFDFNLLTRVAHRGRRVPR